MATRRRKNGTVARRRPTPMSPPPLLAVVALNPGDDAAEEINDVIYSLTGAQLDGEIERAVDWVEQHAPEAMGELLENARVHLSLFEAGVDVEASRWANLVAIPVSGTAHDVHAWAQQIHQTPALMSMGALEGRAQVFWLPFGLLSEDVAQWGGAAREAVLSGMLAAPVADTLAAWGQGTLSAAHASSSDTTPQAAFTWCNRLLVGVVVGHDIDEEDLGSQGAFPGWPWSSSHEAASFPEPDGQAPGPEEQERRMVAHYTQRSADRTTWEKASTQAGLHLAFGQPHDLIDALVEVMAIHVVGTACLNQSMGAQGGATPSFTRIHLGSRPVPSGFIPMVALEDAGGQIMPPCDLPFLSGVPLDEVVEAVCLHAGMDVHDASILVSHRGPIPSGTPAPARMGSRRLH